MGNGGIPVKDSHESIEPSDIMTSQEAAAYLHLNRTTLYRLIHKRQIPFRRLPGGQYQFRRAQLDAWWNQCEGLSVEQAVGGGDESWMPDLPRASATIPHRAQPSAFDLMDQIGAQAKAAHKAQRAL
jgi:excisionase family DNA binding protein